MAESSSSTPLLSLSAVVLDLETTGLDARNARIVQVGAVRICECDLDTGQVFDRLVNPGIAIPADTVAVHGITDAAVANAPRFGDVLPDLEAFIGNALIIGHTISYDLAVLQREFALANKPWRQPRALDTLLLARLAAPTLAHHSLDRLCEWLKVPVENRHSAIGDATTTARLFFALIPLLRERNIRTLAEAEAAIRKLAESDARSAGGFALASLPSEASEAGQLVRIDSYPYRHRVQDVMSTPPVFGDASLTVREGLRLLMEKKVSSVYVRQRGTIGIVTERDLLRALDANHDGGFDVTLGEIMSSPLQTVARDAFIYRAIGRLDRLGFRHLGVTDAHGDIVGAVTSRNLLRQRASSAIMLGDAIDSATSIPALSAAWAKLPLMARSLTAEDIDPRTISAVISSEIRDITRRTAEFAEAKLISEGHGPAPVPYAVLVLGSAGRGESLLAADQDNAIVYTHGQEGGPEDRWFEALGKEMCRMLHEVGIPLCKGGVMASNRAWRMSLEDWKSTIDGWVRRQRPEDLLNVDIFFDGITAHGDTALGEAAWTYAYERGRSAPDFLKLLTEVARQRSPAFTVFGNIRIDEKGRIDLKKAGLLPLFTCARVLSIRYDIRVRSTPERLKGVEALGIGSAQDIDDVIAAHRTILGIMLDQQILDSENGAQLSPRVNPDRLGKAGKRALAGALGKVDVIVDLVGEGRM